MMLVNKCGSLYFTMFILMLSFVFCNGGKESEQEKSQNKLISDSVVTALSDEKSEVVTDLLESLNPPIELSYILNDLDLKFNGTVLADVNKVNSYSSSEKKALALGVYSADLVYCYLHNRTDLAENIQKAIEQLLVELKLDQVVDLNELKTINKDLVDPEELAMEFTFEMENVNNYLKKNKQLNLSALISYSGWVESMYIASIVGKEIGNYPEEIVDLMYYESIVSSTYLELFSTLNELTDFSKYIEFTSKVKSLYEKVQVKLDKVDAKVVHHDSITNVVNVSTQTIKIEQKDFAEIISAFHEMRLDILK